MTNWVVTNLGFQNGSPGWEDKTTVANSSALTLYPSGGDTEGLVRLCVFQGTVTAYTRRLSDENWTERNSFPHSFGNAAGAGVMMNDFLVGTAEVEGQFEYVRFREIAMLTECSSS